ncbi:MAG: TIGR03087 family PEP-CTERM/XrtA system glycosyltransferase [Planctomycetaceae bacterium]|nr:TIGR03087 family PEP-CTERM/XrtA system glycosyltransferase [Planctomycetaceae bacterium]
MSRPQLLYVTHRVPFPPNRGDRIRTYHVLRHLAEKADVTLACLSEETVEPSTVEALNRLCRRVEIVPVERKWRWVRAGLSFLRGRTITEGAFASPRLRAALQRLASDVRFDSVMTSSSALGPYLSVPALSGVPAWIDLIDVDSQKWVDYAAAHRGPKAWLYGIEGRRLRRLECELAAMTRGLFVVSEAEAELFRRFCPGGPIQAVPNGVDVDYFAPQSVPTRNDCVFVGALDYLPNIDAAVHFCHDVWPEIHRRCPVSRMKLVGREPAPAVRDLARIPGVDVVGTVPDVRPYVASAAAVVVPLRIARGVQNKVLEAMAMGKPVITTPLTLKGLNVTPGVHCLAAETPSQWVDAVLSLYNDAELRTALGDAAAFHVQTHHRWASCLAAMDAVVGGHAESIGPFVGLPECGLRGHAIRE